MSITSSDSLDGIGDGTVGFQQKMNAVVGGHADGRVELFRDREDLLVVG